MRKKSKRLELDTDITPETQDEAVLSGLDGIENQELKALQDRISLITSHSDDPIYHDLINESLSDEEKAIFERYKRLKHLAAERLNSKLL